MTKIKFNPNLNKANLRDLIAVTGLVISNWIQTVDFLAQNWIQTVDFSARVTLQFDGWPWKTIVHLFYTTSSCVHHLIHWWSQTGVTVRRRSIRVKIGIFFVPCDLEIWRMTLKINRAPLLSFVHHFIAIGKFKMELQSGNAEFGSKSAIFFCSVWPLNLTNDLEKK